jgi:gliding motility-associated-like protein
MMDSLMGSPDQGGVWIGPGGAVTGSLFNPLTDAAGAYSYIVDGNVPCVADTSLLNVGLLTTPDPVIDMTPLDDCTPVQVVVQNQGSILGDCLWDFGNGDTSSACSIDTVTYSMAGSYGISLTVSLPNGCSAVAISGTSVDVYDKPVAGFNALPPVVNQSNPTVYFQNTAQGWTRVLWDLGEFGVSTDVSPSITFPSELPDEYAVCQIVFAGPVCSDTMCTMIEVGPGLSILVPNSFTPDGNGINDVFVPVVDGMNADSYEFRVFNRWGEEVYLSTIPGEGWDGNYKGSPAQLDVYVWQVIAQETLRGEKVTKMGHVTLVR